MIRSPVILTFIAGWLRLIEGLAMILSLGFYYPRLELSFLVWNHEHRAKG